MALSPDTLAEMKAGAARVAALKGHSQAATDKVVAAVLARCQDTSARAHLLNRWEGNGYLDVRWSRRYTNVPEPNEHRIVFIAGQQITDVEAERAGAWPSELLIAKCALILRARGDI